MIDQPNKNTSSDDKIFRLLRFHRVARYALYEQCNEVLHITIMQIFIQCLGKYT